MKANYRIKNMQTKSKNESVSNPICPVKVQSKSKENQNLNQKEKSKNESVQRLRDKSVIIRERFLI